MAHRTDESGISIVEILVSMLVLGIVLTAFLQVMVNGLQSLSDSNSRQEASQIATESIESLRVLSPSEVALYAPVVADGFEIDTGALSNCTADVDDDGDGTVDRTAAGYDPDGAGPLLCEELATSTQGAVRNDVPYFGEISGSDVETVVTWRAEAGVQDGVRRVTVVTTYELPDGVTTIRREGFFSEVSRG